MKKKQASPFLDTVFSRIRAEDNGCWIWTGPMAGRYGSLFLLRGKSTRPHRFMWELKNKKEIPDGLNVCHHCDVPRCCNPEHLFLGTQTENMHDCIRKNRMPNIGDFRRKLSISTVIALRSEYADKPFSISARAKALGIDSGNLWRAIVGNTYAVAGDAPSHPVRQLKDVRKHEVLPPLRNRDGNRYKFTLSCGHVKIAKAANWRSGIPKQIRCNECQKREVEKPNVTFVLLAHQDDHPAQG